MGTLTSTDAIRTPETTRRAVIYVRISRDKRRGSLNEGLGVAEQERLCRELAERFGYKVVNVYVDNDKSAYSGKPRPAYQRMLADLQSGKADVVLCWHTDRLHRSNVELEDYINVVEPRDIRTETVTAGVIDLNTPIGRMVARNLCTIARYESEHRAERVTIARERQARTGKFGGGRRPYGFEEDGVTVRDDEAEIIRACTEAVLSGVFLKEITRDLRKMGVPTADGKEWEAPYVRDILLRPRNAGLLVHRSGVRGRVYYTPDDVVGNLPGDPIISEDKYWSVVHKLTDPERRTNHAGVAAKWFGSGIYQCPCGRTLRVQNKTYKTRDRRTGKVVREWQARVYRCQESGKGHVIVPQEELDKLVVGAIKQIILESDPSDIIGAENNGGVDVAKLRAEIPVHRAKIEEAAIECDEEIITKAQRNAITKRRLQKIADIEAQIASVSENHNPAVKLVGVADIHAAWDDLTLGEQREILRRFLVVKVKPVGRGRRPAVRDRVDVRKAGQAPTPRAA